MATTEDVIILKVGTDQAVENVKDLKDNIKNLKKELEEHTIGSDKYKDTLEELKINQNALKDAMYATTASLTDITKAATGANVVFDENNKLVDASSISYNELVHNMAALKEEWRATTDEVQRGKLGQKIESVNSRLKEMDASVGNFQRNVGNYQSAFSGLADKFDAWGATLKQFPPTLGPVKESISKVGESMQLVGKQPILGIVGLLAPIIIKIAEALKDNETAMNAVNKAMTAAKPIMDVFSRVIELLAEGLSMVVDWLMDLAGDGGWLGKFTSTITGVGNAVLQYLLTPIRTAIAAFKGLGNIIKDVFTGQWDKIKEDASTAWNGITEAFEQGFSFQDNYAFGQEAGEKFIEGIKSKKAAAAQAGAELQDAFEDGLPEEDESEFNEGPDWDYVLNAEQRQRERDKAVLNAMLEGMKEREEAKQKEIDIEKAAEEAYTKFVEEEEEKKRKARQETIEQTLRDFDAYAGATSNLLNGIADMMESNEATSEKNSKKIKGLRIASATIDMLQGAVSAFSSAFQLGPVAGPIVGAINSAAVIAMGIANINKIKSTDPVSGGDSGGSVSASVSAPTINTNIPTIRTATSASEEDRLNRMANPQKVYILQSDIEAAGSQSRVQIEESSF